MDTFCYKQINNQPTKQTNKQTNTHTQTNKQTNKQTKINKQTPVKLTDLWLSEYSVYTKDVI